VAVISKLTSLQVNDLELTQITDARDAPTVIHGTSKKAWQTIQSKVSFSLLATFLSLKPNSVLN